MFWNSAHKAVFAGALAFCAISLPLLTVSAQATAPAITNATVAGAVTDATANAKATANTGAVEPSWRTDGLAAYRANDYAKAQAEFAEGIASLKAAGPSSDLADAYFWLGLIFEGLRDLSSAEPALKSSLSVLDQLHASAAEKSTALSRLGDVYTDQGHYSMAEDCLKRAYEIENSAAKPDTVELARDCFALARALYKQRKFQECDPLFKRAISLHEKLGEKYLIDLGADLEALGRSYYRQGRLTEAEPLYKRALALKEKGGAGDAEISFSLDYLADLYGDERRFAEAEPIYLRSVKLGEKSLRPDDPQLVTLLDNLGGIYLAQGKFGEAETTFKRALAIAEKHGTNTDVIEGPLNRLAEAYIDKGRYKEAKPLLERALTINESFHGANSPLLVSNLNSLAVAYHALGDFTRSESLLLRALSLMPKDIVTPDTAADIRNLGRLYQQQDKFVAAERYLKKALQIDSSFFGGRHDASFLELEAEKNAA